MNNNFKAELIASAKKIGIDLIGFASKARFEGVDAQHNPFSIFPEGKTVIMLGKRICRGVLRGVEEGTNFGDYSLFGKNWLEDEFLSIASYDLVRLLEDQGWEACPIFPNPSELAIGDSWHGPYTVLGDPHPTDESRTSFHSQISSVFKVPGKKDLYIACADRWLPHRMDVPYELYEKAFADAFGYDSTPEERDAAGRLIPTLEQPNTREADYVWLPFRFDGEMAYLDWHDEWRIEDYE